MTKSIASLQTHLRFIYLNNMLTNKYETIISFDKKIRNFQSLNTSVNVSCYILRRRG